jgi:hypothetical protein
MTTGMFRLYLQSGYFTEFVARVTQQVPLPTLYGVHEIKT